jgi:ribosomal protein L19
LLLLRNQCAWDTCIGDFIAAAGAAAAALQVVPEADRKVYTYKGVCIARANKGPRSWFKLYNVFPDAGGFVQHFPL